MSPERIEAGQGTGQLGWSGRSVGANLGRISRTSTGNGAFAPNQKHINQYGTCSGSLHGIRIEG